MTARTCDLWSTAFFGLLGDLSPGVPSGMIPPQFASGRYRPGFQNRSEDYDLGGFDLLFGGLLDGRELRHDLIPLERSSRAGSPHAGIRPQISTVPVDCCP